MPPRVNNMLIRMEIGALGWRTKQILEDMERAITSNSQHTYVDALELSRLTNGIWRWWVLIEDLCKKAEKIVTRRTTPFDRDAELCIISEHLLVINWRILPVASCAEVIEELDDCVEQTIVARNAFAAVYQEMRDGWPTAKAGPLYEPNDYPTGDYVRETLGISYRLAPLDALGPPWDVITPQDDGFGPLFDYTATQGGNA